MLPPPLRPSVRRSLRVAFALILALVLVPAALFGIELRLRMSHPILNGLLLALHAFGLVALLGWSVLFTKVEPGLARLGLVLTAVLVAFWAFAFFG
jgi:hypothetical protein